MTTRSFVRANELSWYRCALVTALSKQEARLSLTTHAMFARVSRGFSMNNEAFIFEGKTRCWYWQQDSTDARSNGMIIETTAYPRQQRIGGDTTTPSTACLYVSTIKRKPVRNDFKLGTVVFCSPSNLKASYFEVPFRSRVIKSAWICISIGCIFFLVIILIILVGILMTCS